MRIGFAAQNPISHYWQIVNYGVRERATELGITIPILPTSTLDQQIAVIDTLLQQQIDVLLLGPIVAVGLAPTVERVLAAGIPIIVLAAQLTDCTVPCTIRSNHRYGAELAATFAVNAIGGKGAVVHLVGPSRLQDNIDRAVGVRHILAQYPDVQLVFEAESPDWEHESGRRIMRAALDRHPAIDAVCAANDTLALGARTAIEEVGRGDGIVITGFDAIPSALLAIHEGRMHATIRQSIRGIGRTAVDMAVRLIKGDPVAPLVFTDLSLVTRANLTEAALESTVLLPGMLTDAYERGEALAAAHRAVLQAQQEAQAIERKLLETQKLESLGVLAGGIAHDFNNLLVAILGNASLALLDLPSNSPAYESIQQIEIAAQRAADLTRQMLAYAGKGRFIVERIDLNAVVKEMTSLLEVSIPKHVAVHYQLTTPLPEVEADVTQIRQVVMNLVVNAAEAIGEQAGAITVTTGIYQVDRSSSANASSLHDLVEGAYVYLAVSDTGTGMTVETQAQIFDPFFTTKFTGRGLGLAAVLGIARGHKGTVKVESEVGHGSTFTFLLPVSTGRAADKAPQQPVITSWHGRGKILIVDDEPTVRTVTKQMLTKFGLSTLEAGDGFTGLEILRSYSDEISCVLLDMTMPQMNGEATFRLMRQIKPNVRIILMSGYNEQEVTGHFADKGLAGFLHKPFTAHELRAKLQAAIP